jgi:hypothetical protein
LESVQDVHHVSEAHGIDRAKGVAAVIFNNLEHASTLAFP